MKEIKRETRFIETGDGDSYLPRPSGWIGGWARHIWFEFKTKKKPSIASPPYWKSLLKSCDVQKLIEYKDGTHEIITEEKHDEKNSCS